MNMHHAWQSASKQGLGLEGMHTTGRYCTGKTGAGIDYGVPSLVRS
jgi:hypothetical protein